MKIEPIPSGGTTESPRAATARHLAAVPAPDAPQTDHIPLRLIHLGRLTGDRGLYEHALHDEPRRRLGFTTDDNARAVVVLGRMRRLERPVRRLYDRYLEFVMRGRVHGGWHNRMAESGSWMDDRGSDDAHGRALWGLGVAAANPYTGRARWAATAAFVEGCDLGTESLRSNAFAALGAAEIVRRGGRDAEPLVTAQLERFVCRLPRPRTGDWPWPEQRLTYANARIPEALLAAGEVLEDPVLVQDGLELLRFLVGVERGARGFSFTPVGGRGPGERGPAFDQQPVEAWAMADACARAAVVTGDPAWKAHVEDAALWFLCRNDLGAVLYDDTIGASYDGLEAHGVNRNRGAESTLAALGALVVWRQQLARSRIG